MAIRPARLSDIPAIKALGWQAFAESVTYRGMTPDFDALERMVLESPSYVLFVSEGEGGYLNGFLLGQLQRGLFFKEKIATNVIFYVTPEKRGTNIPFRLLRKFQAWALVEGVSQIHLSTSGGINLERNRRFFTRMGFQEAGILCIREVREHEHGRRGRKAGTERAGDATARGTESADEAAESIPAGAVFDSEAAARAFDA